MKIVCITTSQDGRSAGAAAHFEARGLGLVTWYRGVHAEKLGIDTKLPYERDHPGSGWLMGPRPTGCWLSHRTLWAGLLLSEPRALDEILVLEDDAQFPEGWREKFERAKADLPADWNMLYVGSCSCAAANRGRVRGDVHLVQWPMCTHAYLIRARALDTLIRTTDEARCYAPIDISLTLHSLPVLGGVYTLVPRLVDQFNTVLPP